MEKGAICFKQNFTTDFLRKANNYLQACIDHKKVWFASRTSANNEAFDIQSSCHVNLDNVGHESVLDFIEFQDNIIYQTKKQCVDNIFLFDNKHIYGHIHILKIKPHTPCDCENKHT